MSMTVTLAGKTETQGLDLIMRRAFRETKIADLQTNRLIIHIQPDEGITLRFGAKVPGLVMRLGLVNMEFDYTRNFGRSTVPGMSDLCMTA